MEQDSDEGHNTTLLASLKFSRRHLSESARTALPWLGLFRGGVFEGILLGVSQIESAAWERTRNELQSIALLRREDDVKIDDRSYLRFHPTLAIASADSILAERPETRERYIGVYLSLGQVLDKALRGSIRAHGNPRPRGDELGDRSRGDRRWPAQDRGESGGYIQTLSGHVRRLREHDAWIRMLRDAVTQSGFTEEAANFVREHASTLFRQGHPQVAVEKLRALINRLRQTTEFFPAFQLAHCFSSIRRLAQPLWTILTSHSRPRASCRSLGIVGRTPN